MSFLSIELWQCGKLRWTGNLEDVPCWGFESYRGQDLFVMFTVPRSWTGSVQMKSSMTVGKCRFWDSSIFRIRFSFRFWCDDVTSTRCSRDGLWRRRFWDSSIFRIGFSFDDVTSTRGSRDDLWRRRFWAILVRRWWSCAAVFHCDILNP